MHDGHAKVLGEGLGEEGELPGTSLQQVHLQVAQVQGLVHKADLAQIANVAHFEDLRAACDIRQGTVRCIRCVPAG